MVKLEISTNDAIRGIFRVHVVDVTEADVEKLLTLQRSVNEVIGTYGLETRFVNPTQEVKKSE